MSLFLTALLGLGCAEESPPAPAGGAPPVAAPSAAPAETAHDLDVARLAAARAAASPPPLLDVRTPEEYAAGHVPGAVNVPLADLEARLTELEGMRGAPVHVICQSGGRSAKASQLLATKGFDAWNVKGGTAAWIAAGNPVEPGPSTPSGGNPAP